MSKDYLVMQCFGELGRRADDDGRAVVAPLVRALLLIFHLFNVRDVALHVAQTTDLRMKNLYLINSETLLSVINYHCTALHELASVEKSAAESSRKLLQSSDCAAFATTNADTEPEIGAQINLLETEREGMSNL